MHKNSIDTERFSLSDRLFRITGALWKELRWKEIKIKNGESICIILKVIYAFIIYTNWPFISTVFICKDCRIYLWKLSLSLADELICNKEQRWNNTLWYIMYRTAWWMDLSISTCDSKKEMTVGPLTAFLKIICACPVQPYGGRVCPKTVSDSKQT